MSNIDQNTTLLNTNASLNSYTEQFKEFMQNEINDNMMYQTFFKNVKIIRFQNNIVTILVKVATPNFTNKIKVMFDDNINKAIKQIFGSGIQYQIVDKEIIEYEKEISKTEIPNSEQINILKTEKNQKNNTIHSNFNQNYQFDNYVESEFNSEAIRICKQLAFNKMDLPIIYISSKSGYGKTHLLQALGNEFIKQGKRVTYINPTNFARDIAALLQENNQIKISKIIKYYCELDLVLFDDFQIFGDGQKKATKNFIFQIIDGRMQKDKPTVIACESEINELSNMFDNRLITRFSSGFITKIKTPSDRDLNKILDFLLDSCEIKKETLDDKSKEFIVRNHSSSVRALSGAVKRINYYKKDIINADYVYGVIVNAFKDVVKGKENITPEIILKTVAKYYAVTTKDILGKSRVANIVIARHIAMNMFSQVLNFSSTEIGKYFHRDHSTVLNALKKYKDENVDQSTIKAMSYLKEKIFGIN
ncbi:DnaA ATPase domain-containing protein [Mycoplasma buteonis]|uniref:DnaA ATPase domain-containing protein n=1 Tax=Mycoplasma buteonis TaxID=171280 RepID=UPI00055D82E5|nr:DnaA/Hda family protein [Mycoplasma buteonis]